MTPEQINELERLEQAATPAVWRARKFEGIDDRTIVNPEMSFAGIITDRMPHATRNLPAELQYRGGSYGNCVASFFCDILSIAMFDSLPLFGP